MASLELHAADVGARATPPGTVPWHQSLRTRLVLGTSLCSVVLLLAVEVLVYLGARRALLEQSREEIRALTEQTARGLDATLRSLAIAAETLVLDVRGLQYDEADFKALLRATAKADPEIQGAMLVLEPNALHAGHPEFSWYVRLDGNGFYEQPMRFEGYDYHDKPWWQRSARERRPWWSEPYRNAATGGDVFVTYNHPILGADGALSGLVSVDIPLKRLRALVGVTARDDVLFKVLLSPEHLFAIHPDPAVENRMTFQQALMRHPHLAELAVLLEPLRARRSAIAPFYDPISKTQRVAVIQPVGESGWTLGLAVSEDYVLRKLDRTTRNVVLSGLVALALLLAGLHLVAHRITGPILGLTASASHFIDGDFERRLPHTQRSDEVGVMARAFDHARDSIRTQMRDIETMSAAKQKLESELSIARDIQIAMLPRAPTIAAGTRRVETHAMLEPAKTVGGDFYTFLAREDHTLLFAIGDVSDKGVPAALFMARAITTLEVAAGMHGAPDKTLRRAARRLIEGNETCMFATVLCGLIDASTGDVTIASAGHDPPALRRADGRVELVPLETAPPLGVEVATRYPTWHGRLEPGDVLVAWTDGITEALDPNDAPFGIDRLLDEVAAAGSARSACEALVDAAHRHAGGAPQSDDITVLALAYEADAPMEDA